MASIYHNYLNFFDTSRETEFCNPFLKTVRFIHIAKFFLANAKLTAAALLHGHLSKLDPIVGENSCQIRALIAIQAYNQPELMTEAKRVEQQALTMLGIVNRLTNKPPKLNPDLPPAKVFEELKLSLEVSELMDFLLTAHLLTCGKSFSMTREGSEVAKIDIQTLKTRLSKQMSNELIERIVREARELISRRSVDYLQKTSNQTFQVRQIKEKELTFKTICSFSNFKAILAILNQQEIPIVLQEYRGRMRLYSEGLEPNQAVFVIECFFAKDLNKEQLMLAIEKHGFLNLALANVAVLNQYSSDDDFSGLDQKEQDEIIHYRKLGEELGCKSSNPAVFKIAHTHAATMQEMRKS